MESDSSDGYDGMLSKHERTSLLRFAVLKTILWFHSRKAAQGLIGHHITCQGDS